MLNIFRQLGKICKCKAKKGEFIKEEGLYWAIKCLRYRRDHNPVYFIRIDRKPIKADDKLVINGQEYKEGDNVILYGLSDTDFVNYYFEVVFSRYRFPRIRDIFNICEACRYNGKT